MNPLDGWRRDDLEFLMVKDWVRIVHGFVHREQTRSGPSSQAHQGQAYVLDSDWGDVQPKAASENAFLKEHSWPEYSAWFLGLTDGAADDTKARYAFVFGDFRRLHRSGLIACLYRAADWRHKEIERAAYRLLQELDAATS